MGRRFGRAAAAILLVALGAAVVAWVATPDVNDAQARVDAEAARLKVPVLSPADVPEQLALAVVATEDERFYSHHGIDVPGIVRAVVDDVAMRCLCEGGSTITEQLIKEVYLNGSNMGFNKLVDVILAFKVESVLDKPRILADWLTLAPTGPTRYGVAPTACAYFGRPLADLDLAQYALLAGLPQSPVSYDPLTHPEAALRRRGLVLDAMVGHGYISPAEAASARAEPLLPATKPGC
ncbi:MAG TPA: biosynthetic peptidoglycan transglycosylase [Candidatus Dormibacteraeota bacterium]